MGLSPLMFYTTVILGFQLVLLLGCAFYLIEHARRIRLLDLGALQLERGRPLQGTKSWHLSRFNPAPSDTLCWLATLFFLAGMLLGVVVSKLNLGFGLMGMTLMSGAAAPILAVILIQSDRENGRRALKIMVLSVGLLGLLGLQWPLDLSTLRWVIAGGAVLLILIRSSLSLLRVHRLDPLCAMSCLFLVALVWLSCFLALAEVEGSRSDEWSMAVEQALTIYFWGLR